MRRKALGNYGFGNRKQLTNRRVEPLKFFRRTAHVVSMIAPLLLVATIASAQPQQDTKGNAAGNNKAQPQPPIQITVTTPDKSPADKAKEDKRQEREVAAQERVADFTRILTYAAIAQGLATFIALLYAIRSANAARSAAETANQSLRQAYRPSIDIDGPWVGPVANYVDKVTEMSMAGRLSNPSSAFVTVLRIEIKHRLASREEIGTTMREIPFTIPPGGKSERFDARIGTPNDVEKALYKDRKLNIDSQITAWLKHPLGGEVPISLTTRSTIGAAEPGDYYSETTVADPSINGWREPEEHQPEKKKRKWGRRV
jgi:hypothetical protein